MSPPRPAPPPGVLSPAWSAAPEPLPGGRGVGWEARPALASMDLAGSSEVPFSTPSEGAPAPFPPLRSIGLRGLHRRTIRPAALHWLRACPHAHAPSLPPCALSSHCLGSLRRTLAHPCVRHPSARARARPRARTDAQQARWPLRDALMASQPPSDSLGGVKCAAVLTRNVWDGHVHYSL